MEAAGWVDCQVERGDAAPDRKVFSVTEAGRAALEAWIAAPTEMETLRSALMVKLRASAFGDPRSMLPTLRERAAEHAAVLAAYQSFAARDASFPQTTQRALQLHVLKFGLAYEQLVLDWIAGAEALITNLPPPDRSA